MIYNLFDKDDGLYLSSVELPKGRLPSDRFLHTTHELIECDEEGFFRVLKNGKVVIMDENSFLKHRIEIGDLKPMKDEKVFDGLIIKKTPFEVLEAKSSKEVFDFVYRAISNRAAEEICGGFAFERKGKRFVYDSELEDQFNIKTIKDLNMDSTIRCYDSSLGTKNFVMHTATEIKNLHDAFLKFKTEVLFKADSDKRKLQTIFDLGKSNKEMISFLEK